MPVKKPSTRKSTTDAIALLKADHAKVSSLFERYDHTRNDGVKKKLAEQICGELEVHTQVEEEIFYPRVREAIGDDDLMDEATVEHAGAKNLIAQLKKGDIGDDLYGRVLECYRRHWFATYRDQPLLFAGVEAMLADLAGQGYLLGIATGKSRRGLDYALETTGLAPLFQSTRTADEAFSKPHPKMLLDILDDLGVRPAEAMMIGDTTYDLQMARAAGTAGLAVLTGSHTRAELACASPLGCLDNIVDLPAWLAGRG